MYGSTAATYRHNILGCLVEESRESLASSAHQQDPPLSDCASSDYLVSLYEISLTSNTPLPTPPPFQTSPISSSRTYRVGASGPMLEIVVDYMPRSISCRIIASEYALIHVADNSNLREQPSLGLVHELAKSPLALLHCGVHGEVSKTQ
jgi:hypothetical protein